MVRFLILCSFSLVLVQCGGSDGSISPLSDDANAKPSIEELVGEAFNGDVLTIEKNNSTGNILAGGDFTEHNQVSGINRFIRLTSDGIADTAFISNTGSGFNNKVRAVKTLSSGKILVGGDFTVFDGVIVGRLVRLNSDGSFDSAFSTSLGAGFDDSVNAINEASNGDMLITGKFTDVSGSTRYRFARLTSTGTVAP